MKFYNNRMVIPGIPVEDLEDAFEALQNTFTIEWLNKANPHPLRELWKRSDIQSSAELYTLGVAIRNISNVDPLWLRSQVKLMKAAERNNYLGAFAEVLCVNLLNGEGHYTVPAKLNQAGYDAIMKIDSTEKEIRYSIKNYGHSNFERTFAKWAAKTEELVKKLLKKYRYHPVTVLIDCPSKYPTDEKWKWLHSKLDEIFKMQRDADDPFAALCTDIPDWIIVISPNIESKGEFHPDFSSYTFMLTSVYHPNENNNLLSKIEEACTNLIRHSASENDQVKNFLFVHLSPLASIKRCREWLDSYFNEYPQKPISTVLFYQPSVVSNTVTGASNVNHYVYPYIREHRLDEWLPHGFNFIFQVPIGTVSPEPVNYAFYMNHPDGRQERLSADERYIYQRGNHYLKMKPNDEGGFSGVISQLSPGIFINVVIEIPNQPGKAAIAGKFPPNDELLIL